MPIKHAYAYASACAEIMRICMAQRRVQHQGKRTRPFRNGGLISLSGLIAALKVFVEIIILGARTCMHHGSCMLIQPCRQCFAETDKCV